jgi:hypothetical protein
MILLICAIEWVIFIDCKDNYLAEETSFSQCLNYGSDAAVNCMITVNYSATETGDISLVSGVTYTVSSSCLDENFSLTLDIKKINIIGICIFQCLEVFKFYFIYFYFIR